MRTKPLLTWCALLGVIFEGDVLKASAEPARIEVETSVALGTIEPEIFGHFTELTLTSFTGGIHGELLVNRKFDEPFQPDALQSSRTGAARFWEPISLVREVVLHTDPRERYSGQYSQKITLSTPGGAVAGVRQRGLQRTLGNALSHPLRVRKGEQYAVRLAVKGGKGLPPVEVALGSEDDAPVARHTIREVTKEWRVHTFTLQVTKDCDDTSFFVYINQPGTVWVDSASLQKPDALEGVFWKTALELTRGIEPTLIRFPGGSMVADYRWEEGIGPVDQRPSALNHNWRSYTTNDTGTAEFIDLCRRVGAAPYLCVNVGTGTAEEAAAWVEYCNGSPQTAGGRLRAQHGHPEPFSVKYWGIGNESGYSHEIGAMNATEYAELYLRFSSAMHAVDPSIELIASGLIDVDPEQVKEDPAYRPATRYWVGWTKELLKRAGDKIAHYAVHYYGPHTVAGLATPEQQYLATVSIADDLAEHVKLLLKDMEDAAPAGKTIPIALDEWAATTRDGAPLVDIQEELLDDFEIVSGTANARGLLGPLRGLAHALAEAGVLNLMQNHPRNFSLGCRTFLYGFGAGAVGIRREDAVLSPPAQMMSLYSTRVPCEALKNTVSCERYTLPRYRPAWRGVGWLAPPEMPLLHVSARRLPGGEVQIFVVNRAPAEPVEAEVELKGFEPSGSAEIVTLRAAHYTAWNAFDAAPGVSLATTHAELAAGTLRHVFPPHSLTRITCPQKDRL